MNAEEEMKPLVAGMLNDLALIYADVGELNLAEKALRIAMEKDPHFLGAGDLYF